MSNALLLHTHDLALEVILDDNQICPDIISKINFYLELANPKLLQLNIYQDFILENKRLLITVMTESLEKIEPLVSMFPSERYQLMSGALSDFKKEGANHFECFTEFLKAMLQSKKKPKVIPKSFKTLLTKLTDFPEKETLLQVVQASFRVIQQQEPDIYLKVASKAANQSLRTQESVSVTIY